MEIKWINTCGVLKTVYFFSCNDISEIGDPGTPAMCNRRDWEFS